MELIKKVINLGSLKDYSTPLVYELLFKELRVKGCLDLNTKQLILQNAEDVEKNWGKFKHDTIYLNLFLTQNIDDMGIFTDVDFVDQPASYQLLFDKFSAFTTPTPSFLLFSGSTSDPSIRYIARFSGYTASNYFASNGLVSGLTDSKLYSVTSYSSGTPYIIGLNFSDDPNYYTGINSIGVDNYGYSIDALSTNVFGSGLQYKTYNFNRLVYNSTVDQYFNIPYTTFQYNSEGWNNSNTSLSALTKEEIYFGVVFSPKIDNNVFIDRGSTGVFTNQSRLSSILSVGLLEIYGNKYYNLIK